MKDCYKKDGNHEYSSIVTSTKIHLIPAVVLLCIFIHSFSSHPTVFLPKIIKFEMLNAVARWRRDQLSTLRRRPSPPQTHTTSVVLIIPVQSRLCSHLGRIRTHTHTHRQREPELRSSSRNQFFFFGSFVSSARESTLCVC